MNRKTAAWIYAVLIILTVIFIWGQSMLPRETSSKESNQIVDEVKPIVDPKDKIPRDEFHNLIRKIAHFVEFGGLGFFTMSHSTRVLWKKRPPAYLTPMAFTLSVAIIDEVIQIFSTDRGPGAGDVLLDFCGALFGIGIAYLFYITVRKKKAQ